MMIWALWILVGLVSLKIVMDLIVANDTINILNDINANLDKIKPELSGKSDK